MAGLEQVRGIYREYDRMLTEFLRKQGIRAEGTRPEGLNENGQPDGYHGQEGCSRGMARLRQNEQAVETFRFAGGWFAIPAQGYALRYLIPS